MGDPRDYVDWHRAYDDPDSALSWRLRTVQALLRTEFDGRPGALRVLSACSGDGRDVLGVLAGRADSARVTGTLLELHPRIADGARVAAASLPGIEIRTVDAGESDAYVGTVPADVVLLVGILGNIGDADAERLVRTAPQFCAPSALLLWSRRTGDDLNDRVRAWFADAGFDELVYDVHPGGESTSIGAMRYAGPPVPLRAGRTLFTFYR